MTGRSSPALDAHARPLTALLSHAIDYAGLFPPAALSMPEAIREYHAQRSGPDAWALGRFVLGVGQLDAFVAARRELPGDAWPLAVIATGADDAAVITGVAASQAHLLTVAAVEARGDSPAAVAALAPLARVTREMYVEVPLGDSLYDILTAVTSLGVRAKIRTGGITADAFPSAWQVARFMRACADSELPFKATAGLHHLVRGEYPLTYEKDSPRATMFGFLNVFAAAAFARQGAAIDRLVEVLEERDPTVFTLHGDRLCWRDACLTLDELSALRSALGSVGSCSFREPIAELTSAFPGAA